MKDFINDLHKEAKRLGLINIEECRDETLLKDIVDAVKSVDLDFDKIKKESEQCQAR